MADNSPEEQPDIKKLTIATFIGVVVLGAVVYGAYVYSQQKGANLALPGGTTYLGQNPSQNPNQPPTAPLRFTADTTVSWVVYTGKLFPYSFSYPATLPLVYFPGDNNDPVGIAWGNVPAQFNILLNIENIDKRDPKYVARPKTEYVNNWYKYFSGLKGVSKVEQFTSTNGLIGYKATYINYAGVTPNLDVFFEVPGRPSLMIHLANGILEPDIFSRLIDSVKWETKSEPSALPTESISPTPLPPSPTTQ